MTFRVEASCHQLLSLHVQAVQARYSLWGTNCEMSAGAPQHSRPPLPVPANANLCQIFCVNQHVCC